MAIKRYSTGESVPAHTWPVVDGETYVHADDYDALQSINAELLDALESICLMQSRNYGDATQTHLDLPELTDKAKAVIAKARNAQ